jgi:hypothetical protein
MRSTTEQLRNAIDSGRTGEKIPGPDPAMAPLGTDDEAAGKPPSPASVELTRQIETKTRKPEQEPQEGLGAAWILVGFTAALGAALIIMWAVLR